MKAPVPVPQDQLGWLREIAAAYCDAQEAIRFGRWIGEPIAEGDLFHIAPRVALKVRGLRASPRNLKKATAAVRRGLPGCSCVRHWTTTASCYNNLFQRLAGASIIRVDSGPAVAPATAEQYVS